MSDGAVAADPGTDLSMRFLQRPAAVLMAGALLGTCALPAGAGQPDEATVRLEFENASPATALSIGVYADDYDCSGFQPIASVVRSSRKLWTARRKPYQTVSLQYMGVLPHPREDSFKFTSCTTTVTFRADQSPRYRITTGSSAGLCRVDIAQQEPGPSGDQWMPVQGSIRQLVAALPSPPAPWCLADAAYRAESTPAGAEDPLPR